MAYTVEQLQQMYNTSPPEQWIIARNDDLAVSSSSPKAGVWKIYISVDPTQMEQAIAILHKQFYVSFPDIPMRMEVAPKALLDDEHESGKEIALVFDRRVETSRAGREAILRFLWLLAIDFEQGSIKPDTKPPLTCENRANVLLHGSTRDIANTHLLKIEAPIKFKKEGPDYFYYHDASVSFVYDKRTKRVPLARAKKLGIVYASNFVYKARYLHNPLKRTDDFLYGIVLDRKFNNLHKKLFLQDLKKKLQDPQACTRADILILFQQIKEQNGDYAYIHRQQSPRFDSFRDGLFKSIGCQPEKSCWQTDTYQKAVQLLKEAYTSPDRQQDQSVVKEDEANALIDYVRGNSPVHFKTTTTRDRVTPSRRIK